MKIDWKRKLTSRKFWVCLSDFVAMIMLAMHFSQNVVAQTTAIIMGGGGMIAYIIAEGLVDAENAQYKDVFEVEETKPPEELEPERR